MTGTSTPLRASATSCTENGLTVVRAPTQRMSTPAFNASSTWRAVATSTVTGKPVSFLACINQGSPSDPLPSTSPGRVLGFQLPARRAPTLLWAFNWLAVARNYSTVSALHGPAITRGSPDERGGVEERDRSCRIRE